MVIKPNLSESVVIFYVVSKEPIISLLTDGTVLCIGILSHDKLWFTCLMTPSSYYLFFILKRKMLTLQIG